MKMLTLLIGSLTLCCTSHLVQAKENQSAGVTLRQRLESVGKLLSRDSYQESQLEEAAITVRSVVTMASIFHTALSLLLHDTTDENSTKPDNAAYNVPTFNMNENFAHFYMFLYKSFEVALEKEPFFPLATLDCIRNYMNFETALSRIDELKDRMKTASYAIPPVINILEFLVQKYATRISKWWLPEFDQYHERRMVVFSAVMTLQIALAAAAFYFSETEFLGKKKDDFMNCIKPLIMTKIFRLVAEEAMGQRMHEKMTAPLPTSVN